MKYFLFFFSLLASLTVYAQSYDCQITHTMVRPEGEFNASWQLFVNNDNAIIKLDGLLRDRQNGNAIISRQIFFSVEKFSERGFHFTSQRIKKHPADTVTDEAMASYYPDFFIHENRRATFTITRADQSFIMSWATDPMFFCY